MSTPDFSKPSGSGPSDPYAPPPGGSFGQPAGSGSAGGYGQPGYGDPAGSSYGGSGFGGAPGYGAPGGFGTPAPYGSAGSGVVGPGGEWLGPPLASWGARLGGYLLDTLIVVALSFGAAAVDANLGNVVNLLLVLVLGYLTGTTGQTPGRKALGIKVLRLTDGQVLGAGAGIGRQFLHILDALPLLLGYFWPIWDKKNQTFADKIIGSVVVKA